MDRQRLLLCLSFFSESSQPFAAGRQTLNNIFRRFFTDSSLFLRELLYNRGVYPVRDCGARPQGKETYCHENSQTGPAHRACRVSAGKSRRGVGHRRRRDAHRYRRRPHGRADQDRLQGLRHRARQRQGADRHESGRAAVPQRCHQRRADRHEGHLLHLHRGACRRKRHDRQHVAHYLLHEPDVHQRAGDCRHHGREDQRGRAVRRLGHCGADRYLQGV